MMPSYVNIGAYVGANTMVDTWATVGSCAQIGANVHLSGGVGIGGVLEPPNAAPVIIGDDSDDRQPLDDHAGASVGEGSVLGEGVILNPSIPVIDAETGEEVSRGVVPPWSVGVSAARRRRSPAASSACPACCSCAAHARRAPRQDAAQPDAARPRRERPERLVTDLLALTAELVDIPSVSHDEDAITDHLEGRLRAAPGSRSAHRRQRDRPHRRRPRLRLVLAGHTDTVPANGNEVPRVDGDTLWGLGASDMKTGLAVMLELARTVPEPAVDVTYVFYVAEEVAADHNGLRQLFATHPDLLAGDVALLGEPTSAAIEAGCQGTMRMDVRLRGQRPTPPGRGWAATPSTGSAPCSSGSTPTRSGAR